MFFDELSNRVIGCAKGIHEAPLLTYMKLAGVKIGLLIHFSARKDGCPRSSPPCLRFFPGYFLCSGLA